MDFSKFIDAIKLPPRYLFAGALVTGLLLFGGEGFLSRLGLDVFVDTYRPWIGVLFLLSVALWVTHGIAPWATIGYKRFNEWLVLRRGKLYLRDLTPAEREIVKGYLEHDTRTRKLSIMSGVVQGLEAQKILYRSSNLGRPPEFDYNIQPWAWDYLREHPHLLMEKEAPSGKAT